MRAIDVLVVEGEPSVGPRIYGHLLRYADGREWIAMGATEVDHGSFGPRLARALSAPLEGLSVTLDIPALDRLERDHDAYEDPLPPGVLEVRCCAIDAGGRVRVVETPDDGEEPRLHGDAGETVEAELWDRFHRAEDEVERVRISGFVRPEGGVPLPPRLDELRTLIVSAGAFELTSVGSKTALRVEFQGSRRLAVVSEDELRMLVAASGIEPRSSVKR